MGQRHVVFGAPVATWSNPPTLRRPRNQRRYVESRSKSLHQSAGCAVTFTGAEWRLVQQESASRVMQLWHYDWMAQVPKGSSRGHQATLAIPREPNPYIAPRTVGAFGTFATKRAALGILVVFAVTADPVGSGLVESGFAPLLAG